MFGLFLDNDEGQPAEALDWFDKSDLDLAPPLERYIIILETRIVFWNTELFKRHKLWFI